MRTFSMLAWVRTTLTFILAVVCSVAWAPVVFGQDGASDSKAMLILDASSSMLAEDADGSRIDAAKQAADDLVELLPETAVMGLMVYGAKESDASDNRDAGCKDIETLVPVGKVDKERFTKAIAGVSPKGYTPMGNSLRAAAEELGDQGQRSIILVSDGIDSCAPPPVCEVAKELAADGVDLAIHTVGFKVDDAAREELQCIADAGNGQFLEADDASSLSETLKFLSQRDVGKYKLKGTKFEFADDPEDAEWLGEGQYQTKVEPDTNVKKDRYFRVSVPEGHNALISITPVWQSNGDVRQAHLFLDTSDVTNEVDSSCGEVKTTLGNSSIFGNAQFGIDPYEIAIRRDGQDDKCDMSTWLIGTQVYQTGDDITEDVNLEVNIFHEPIPEAGQAAKWESQKISSPGRFSGDVPIMNAQDITGGSGFNDAVEISEGSYADKIVPGEFRFYKIPVSWGQRPVIKLRTPESETSVHDGIGFGFHDPLRSKAGDGSVSMTGQKADESDPVAPSDVAWFAPKSPTQGYFFAWVGMGSKGDGEITGVEQPYEFAVALDGELADGGPDWTPTYEDGPDPADAPIQFDSASESKPSANEPKETAKDGSGEDEQAADESSSSGWVLPAAVGTGIFLLLLLGLVVFLVARSKRG